MLGGNYVCELDFQLSTEAYLELLRRIAQPVFVSLYRYQHVAPSLTRLSSELNLAGFSLFSDFSFLLLFLPLFVTRDYGQLSVRFIDALIRLVFKLAEKHARKKAFSITSRSICRFGESIYSVVNIRA